MSGLEREGRHLFDVSNNVLGAIMNCVWIGERGGRQLFDFSSTVLCAIMYCEWIDEGVGDTCLMLSALCWLRY